MTQSQGNLLQAGQLPPISAFRDEAFGNGYAIGAVSKDVRPSMLRVGEWLARLSAHFYQSLRCRQLCVRLLVALREMETFQNFRNFRCSWQPAASHRVAATSFPNTKLCCSFHSASPIRGAAFPFQSQLRNVTLVNIDMVGSAKVFSTHNQRRRPLAAQVSGSSDSSQPGNVRRRAGVVEWPTPNDQRACAVMLMTNPNFDVVPQARRYP